MIYRQEASGQLAKSFVAYMWKGLQCVRAYVVPKDPKSPAQLVQRAKLAQANRLYHTFVTTEATRKQWKQLRAVQQTPMTGYNMFLSSVMKAKASTPDPLYCDTGWWDSVPDAILKFRGLESAGPSHEWGRWRISYAWDLDGPWIQTTKTLIRHQLLKVQIPVRQDRESYYVVEGNEFRSGIVRLPPPPFL